MLAVHTDSVVPGTRHPKQRAGSPPGPPSQFRTMHEESLASGRDGSAFDPGREVEERLLDALAG